MKYFLSIFSCFIVFHITCFASIKWSREAITGEDIIEILNMDITKEKLTFDGRKKVLFKAKSAPDYSINYHLNDPTQHVTLRLYIRKTKDPKVALGEFTVKGEVEKFEGAFQLDPSKLKLVQTTKVDNGLLIVGHSTKDKKKQKLEEQVFEIRLIVSDK